MLRVSAARASRIVVRLQVFAREGVQRIQQAEARLAVSTQFRSRYEVLFGKPGKQRQHFISRQSRHGCSSKFVPPARKHGQSIEERPLLLGQQVVAPADRSTQRAVAVG